MKKNAFTLMEVLLAMAIIGVLATAAANTLGNIGADKTKVAFKNCYNHMVQTIDSIVSDETKCPTRYHSTDIHLDSTGHRAKQPLRDACVYLNASGTITSGYSIFPMYFRDATSYVSSTSAGSGYEFEAKNGSYWIVTYNPENDQSYTEGTISSINKTDYLIVFDVNGIGVGSDCPYKLAEDKIKSNEGSNCSNPDTFRFGLTYDNQILPDTVTVYNSKNLTDYMADENLIETEF